MTKSFLLICLYHLCLAASLTMLMPALPLYLNEIAGGEAGVGLVMSASVISGVATRILAGRAADIWGRRGLVVGGAACLAVVELLYVSVHDIPSLVLVRVLHGAASGAGLTAAAILAADLMPRSRRAEGIGYFTVVGNLAMTFSPAVALWLLGVGVLDVNGFPLVFTVAAALAVLSVLVGLLLKETAPVRPKSATPIRRPELSGFFSARTLPVAVVMLCCTSAYAAITTFLPIYAGRANAAHVAVYFVVYSAVALLSRPLSGVFADRLGPRRVVIPAIVMLSTGVGVLAISPDLPQIVAAAVLLGIGFGAVFPTLMALAVDTVSVRHRGAALGTFMAGFDVGMSGSAIWFGAIAQGAGYRVMYLTAGALGFLGLLYLLSYPRLRREHVAVEQE